MRTRLARNIGRLVIPFMLTAANFSFVGAQEPSKPLPKSYPAPKVPIAFNRLYDYPELVEAMRALAKGCPDLFTLASIGKSVEGRDLWCLTLNNPKTGPDRSKPAMYVDGNIHGNEVQGAEAALYVAWYLAENRDRVESLKKLTDERAFYIIPTVNPDGRAYWFNAPNTTHSSRSGKSPRDDDRDGLFDEDGFDDLDGDGQITQMRRKNPHGRFKINADDPRIMDFVKPEEEGTYDLLGSEGIDNDGDGLINEDGPGGYDMNRNWPADWQPEPTQLGAGEFPLCWPETRSVAEFILDHPNIAGVQAFHNAAGMILRGPGHPSRQAEYPGGDEQVASGIGTVGERMIPFYRNFVIHKDLYSVHGGFINWTYEILGIFSFTNELWNNEQLLGRPASGDNSLARAIGGTEEASQLFANDKLLFGAQFKPWRPAKHPVYGDIEIGGFVRESQRVPPTFMIEELCHRNAAFVIYHAEQMPRIEWDGIKVEALAGSDLYQVTATVHNTRTIPSISQQAAHRKAGLPDTATIAGEGLTVVAGGPVVNVDTGEIAAEEFLPATIKLESGVSGKGVTRVRWFVKGKPGTKVALRYASQKAGTLTAEALIP